MQTLKQKGFTLIELLVVIVIIGILATISVATFSGYFAKARDAERLTAVSNAATIMKTARAVDTITTFDVSSAPGTTIAATKAAGVNEVLSEEGGYAVPAASVTGFTYTYINNGAKEFAIFTCSEETDDTVFVDGTSDAVSDVTAGKAAMCDSTSGFEGTIAADAITINSQAYEAYSL